jgi:hypothetical protein
MHDNAYLKRGTDAYEPAVQANSQPSASVETAPAHSLLAMDELNDLSHAQQFLNVRLLS